MQRTRKERLELGNFASNKFLTSRLIEQVSVFVILVMNLSVL
jgi:hypothetical protein